MKYLFLAIVAISSILPACAQERKSPHETVTGGNISITYGRPAKKGREIFGALVPYGQVWRAGADEATEITFKKDGSLGGKAVKAGTYTLFITPTEKSWTIILNSQLKQWGAFDYEKNKAKNVLEVSAPVNMLGASTESFTIKIAGGKITFEWDKTQVSVPAS
ncbi:DUF2911 domain-containing protein [Flavihumibacter profundi]|jgi:hypothetical protein|uniref:DUF2911 domain-containing protein n=1 Tax=Flavihumibacter profundi TaxID=2716883 RepID=UPI001CC526EF|nr:DUF2911 domain-containing protein [Flavihumibacter profundi]MBZ5856493.1 DUF2911 domain-containing protein [Flavihumibacter profundi]